MLVPTESAKRIVVGAGGATIGTIGGAAEEELQEMWGHPVFITLKVKVEKAAGGGA